MTPRNGNTGFFSPALQSLLGFQQASQLKSVQKKLGVGRVSLGSLSESCRVFDPELLVPLLAARGDLTPRPPLRNGEGERFHRRLAGTETAQVIELGAKDKIGAE